MAPLLLRRRDVTFFAVYTLAVLGLIVKGSPLITAFSLLPQFRSLHSHSPDRIYIILFIGPAVLAGFLVDALADRRRRSPRHSRLILVVELPAVRSIGALILVQAKARCVAAGLPGCAGLCRLRRRWPRAAASRSWVAPRPSSASSPCCSPIRRSAGLESVFDQANRDKT